MAKAHRLLREHAGLWLAVCIVAALSGCHRAARPFVVDPFPRDSLLRSEMRAAVLANAPDMSEFNAYGGDAQRLVVMVGGTRTYGPLVRIYPHKNAHRGSWQTHGKVLARIWSETEYNGTRLHVPAGWSYWLVAQLNGNWSSLIVSETSAAVYQQPIYFTGHSGEPCDEKARFVWFDDGEAAWGCCEPDGCCCTSPTCSFE